MAKNRLVKNKKGQYGIYDPYTDEVTPVDGMSLVKNTRGKYGFQSGNSVIELDEVPQSLNLEETFKKKVATASSSKTSSTGSTSDFYKPVGAELVEPSESAKPKALTKTEEKQAEGGRFVDMFGLGQIDYSGLQKYGTLGELAADVVDIPANLSKAIMRGLAVGQVGSAIYENQQDGMKLDSDKIARLNKENIKRTGSTYLKALQEKGILQTDDLSAAGGIAEVALESIGSMIGTYKQGFEGAVIGGAAGMLTSTAAGAIGGPVGSAISGTIGTVGSALAGMRGMASYVSEYGSSIMQSLSQNGYDITDKNQIEAAFKNEKMMNDAKDIANKRGVAIGMFDAITAGVAGKASSMAIKVAERSALAAGKELTKTGAKKVAARTAFGIETIGGPLGEATAQIAEKGKITDFDAVALEAVADLGPAAPSAIYAMYKAGQINSDLNQGNLDKIDALKKSAQALSEDSGASKKAIENKITSLEKENKDRNKLMTNALQVAPVPATVRVLELTDSIADIESTLEAIKDGSRTDIDSESRKALWDSMNDMIAERDEIRQEMLKSAEDEAKINMAPEKPMKPVVFIGDNAEGIVANNATSISRNAPLEISKEGVPITFSEKFKDAESAKPATAYKVSQGNNNFGTIIQYEAGGEKEFVLAETGKKFSSLNDAKFALQEKLTGERVSELERTGIDRIKVEGNLANKEIFVGNKDNNNQLGIESKSAIQKAVRAMRSVSNANVYLYSNSDEYTKGIAQASGKSVDEVSQDSEKANAQVVDANGENSIHINLEKADGTTISHEVFHGALLGLAKKDPNAFISMRDNILNRISDNKSLSVTGEDGVIKKVSAKEYLDDFQKRYSGPEFTEADRAEEFLSELAGLMSLEDSDVVKDKSLLDSIKLVIKDVLKKFNVEFNSLNELQESQDMVDFFKAFNRSIKTGESINLAKIEGVQGAAQPTATQPTADKALSDKYNFTPTSEYKFTTDENGNQESEFVPMFTIKNEVDEASKDKGAKDVTFYAQTEHRKSLDGAIATRFFRDIQKPESEGSYLVTYRTPQSIMEDRSGLTYDGGKVASDFKDDYGISIEQALSENGMKLSANQEVYEFQISSEVYNPTDYAGNPIPARKVYFSRITIKNKETGKTTSKEFFELVVPKLKYTDAITGLSAAQPEAGAAKEVTKGGPKEPKKKQSINAAISAATDEAVKVKKEGKKTVGNRVPIKDRFKRLDLINDALAIEPTTPLDMALQYFISGGKVLRGRVQDDKKRPLNPTPHSLVTLFAKKKFNIWKSDNEEMRARLQLVEDGAPTIEGIAHILWESQSNKTLKFETEELRDAVIEALLGNKSRAAMATSLVQAKGTLSQQAILDGDQMLASMNEADAMAAQFYADKAGVSVEEFMEDPSKYMDEEEMVEGYSDMQTAFDILDSIQDLDAVKSYLELSAPEDLFLDELVAEVAKPKKSLEDQKDELLAEQKAVKKELSAVKKKWNSAKDSAQISFIDGVQKKIFPPDTISAYQKMEDLQYDLGEIKKKIDKVESAIEFKGRNTIDAFADVIEQKAEESAIPSPPENTEDYPQWLKEQDAEYALMDKEDLELMKLNEEMNRAKQKIAGSRNTQDAINEYNEVKAKRDAYMDAVVDRRQKVKDARDLQSLIDDEVNGSDQPKYEYAEEFKRDPLLAAYKRAQEMLVEVSSSDYVDYIVEKGYDTRQQALVDQKRSIANYERNMFLIENAIVKESMAEQAAKVEPATTETSKEIKFLLDEIQAYENEIQDSLEEIENTKANYKEDVAALKEKKAEIRAAKMDRDSKEEALDEVDAEIEEAAETRDDYIEQYKETISEAKKEIKSLQKQIDKLNVKTKPQLSGDRVAPFLKADPTYKYQMSGTEASLKLIDNVRAKYRMQHTAEEMGMVGKGIRATEKMISDNVVTKVLGGASASIYKRFANDRANKLIGKPFAMLQDYLANNVRKGLSSQNASAAKASAYATGLIQNLGSTADFQSARNKLVGGKSVAKNELWQLGKELNEMINNDKVALKRVHSLLDPEAFDGVTDPMLPDSKADLSFAELRLFNVLRDMNDYIHEWHYKNGFLGEGEAADILYEKNKGSYFARMYNEIENKQYEDLYDALAKLPNSADFSMFKERKDFAEVTESLTLKEDPIYITTKRFGQMMQNQAILQFCDYVSKSKDYQIYSSKDKIPAGAAKAGNYRQMPYGKGGSKRYGDLTGKFVPDIVAQQLLGIEFSNQIVNLTYQAAKVFDKSFARQVLSKAKTTWNPLTRVGNITMNFVFASLAGVDPITLLKNRPSAKESLDSYDSYARDLDANGLLGVSMGKELQDVNEKEAKATLLSAAESITGIKVNRSKKSAEEAPQVPASKGRILADKTIALIKETDQMLTDSYGKADDVAKLALYRSLVDDYGKTREEAINIVATSMQNYNTVGKAYDYASKSVNRFVKFKADSGRILYNTFKERPLNLMATLGIFLAAQALSSKLSGEDEEERKIREERPYTNKIKIGPVTISLTMKFGDTEVNVARYLAPYSQYDAGYNSNTFKDITTYLPIQYDETTVVGVNDPMIGPLVNLAFDKDFRGMPISDPGVNKFISKTVTWEESMFNRAAFLGRNYGAPYYGWAENLYAAASGNKDYYGRTRDLSDAALNTVIKVQKVDNESLQKSHESMLRRLDTEYSDAGKTISHKADMIYRDIAEKSEQEGISKEALDKFTAKKENELGKFVEEQQALMDKKVIEMEQVQEKITKLQEIAQRKKKD